MMIRECCFGEVKFKLLGKCQGGDVLDRSR